MYMYIYTYTYTYTYICIYRFNLPDTSDCPGAPHNLNFKGQSLDALRS